jgi:HAE1 family hydrophobic/amphiphilic exporter-1
MSGVDNMNYMYSVNANNGDMTLRVNFDVATDPNIDQILAQLRVSQATSQLPADVNNYGVTVQKSTSAPLMLVALYSPKQTYDGIFLANYAYINLNDQLTRVPGISNVQVFGAGQYAMQMWVKPDRLAKLGVTVSDIVTAIQNQNNVNPAGQIGSEPIPKGQKFTYTVRAQARLESPEEFSNIVIRANSDGSFVRVKDVARIELGAQTYNVEGRLNGKPSAILALYQLPGSNAIAAANGVRKLMAELKQRFPADMDYVVSLDQTQAVTEGMNEILQTLLAALVLVIIVVFIFLQGWRATLIPLCAVPVSLIGTFMLFPAFGFSINTLSLFGLVLAIGLVVDDAIVVVEAVERHIEEGMSPRDATLKAMEEVSGPVIGIALVLSAVFVPTVFIPGITGRLYQQFALTIAISVILSAFNALTLSPALSSLLLRPKKKTRGPLGWFYDRFNRLFGSATNGYVSLSRLAVHKSFFSLALLLAFAIAGGFFGLKLPASFLPEEDQGYLYIALQLPDAASLERTDEACRKVEEILSKTPGIKYTTSVIGFSLLSNVQDTYSGFFFVTLDEWSKRKKPEEQYDAIKARLNRELSKISEGISFSFPPPAIPGIGASGGFTFILEDRAGKDIAFLDQNLKKFMETARKRPEITGLSTTFLPTVPQLFVKVDRDKVLKQGVDLAQVYQTLQTFMGGSSLTISTASVANGRFISKLKAITAPTRRTSASFMSVTATIRCYRWTQSQPSKSAPARNLRCAITNIAPRRSTVQLRLVIVPHKPQKRSKKPSSKRCPLTWVTTTSACLFRKRRRRKVSLPGLSSPCHFSSSSSSSPRFMKVGPCLSACFSELRWPSSALSQRCFCDRCRTTFTRRSGLSCSLGSPRKTPS